MFKTAGLQIKITSTSFRKAAVTMVHIDKPQMSGKLADLVAHNEGPAKKYYLLSEKSKTSVEVSKKLGRLMRSDDSTIRRHRIRQAISRIRMAVFPMSWLVKVQQKRANHVKAQI